MLPVYSIIGFSGSGKTTLIEKVICEIKDRGLRVAVWKHDAHEFEVDHEGKDSYRITKAGADMTVLSSASKAVIMENRVIDVDTILGNIHDVDLILTEGYKHGEWKKIAINRTASGKGMAISLDESFVVMSDVEVDTKAMVIDINDAKNLVEYIIADMKCD